MPDRRDTPRPGPENGERGAKEAPDRYVNVHQRGDLLVLLQREREKYRPRRRSARRLAVGGNVAFTPPCLLCMENHQ
jgi:hypothetical protein